MEIEDLSPEVVTRNLATRFVGQRVVSHPILASTMDVARREARQGAAAGTVVLADRQTAGRGRMERVWLTPGGNIALSLIPCQSRG